MMLTVHWQQMAADNAGARPIRHQIIGNAVDPAVTSAR
jgi:hypothetical protein